MNTPPPLTVKLRNGATVLAKLYKGEPEPVRYSNRTQAQAAAEKHGGVVARFLGRPFYVVFYTTRPV